MTKILRPIESLQKVIVDAAVSEEASLNREDIISCGLAGLACNSCGFISSIHRALVKASSFEGNSEELEFNLSMDELLVTSEKHMTDYTQFLVEDAYDTWNLEAVKARIKCKQILTNGCTAEVVSTHVHLESTWIPVESDD